MKYLIKRIVVFPLIVFSSLMLPLTIFSFVSTTNNYYAKMDFTYVVKTIYVQNLYFYLREDTLITAVEDECKEKGITFPNGDSVTSDIINDLLSSYIKIDSGSFSIQFTSKSKEIVVPLTRIYSQQAEIRLNIRYGLKENKIICDYDSFNKRYSNGPSSANNLLLNILYSFGTSFLLAFVAGTVFYVAKRKSKND